MIDRISIVSRLAQTLYADGVPADRVKYIPHHIVLFDAIAQSYATGTAPSIPLALMAGELCPYEPVGGSELDQPIPFMVVEPSPAPSPDMPPAPAGAVVEGVVEAATPAPKKGAALRHARVDWSAETRLGKMSDSKLARELGVTSNAARMARLKRGIPPAVPTAPEPVGARKSGQRAGIEWDAETRLGKIPDATLAASLGVNPSAVQQARVNRGIPSAGPSPKHPAPPTVTPERQAELDKIEAAVKAGKIKRITPEEAKADFDAKHRAQQAQYGWKSRAQKKGKAVAS